MSKTGLKNMISVFSNCYLFSKIKENIKKDGWNIGIVYGLSKRKDVEDE